MRKIAGIFLFSVLLSTPLVAMNSSSYVNVICEKEWGMEGVPYFISVITNNNLTVKEKFEILNWAPSIGNDINRRDQYGRTALFYACSHGYSSIVQLLFDRGAKIQKGLCVETRSLETLKILYKNGADITSSVGGMTPLDWAVMGDMEMVTWLIENGADIEGSCSPLLRAMDLSWCRDIAMYLIKKGANVNKTYLDSGWSALHYAVKKNDLELVKLLVQRGANLNLKNGDGETPVFIAMKNGFYDLVKYLVEKGANLKQTNNNGWTLLHLAVLRGVDIEFVKFLVQKGAGLNGSVVDSGTPLQLAKKMGYYAIADYLALVADFNMASPLAAPDLKTQVIQFVASFFVSDQMTFEKLAKKHFFGHTAIQDVRKLLPLGSLEFATLFYDWLTKKKKFTYDGGDTWAKDRRYMYIEFLEKTPDICKKLALLPTFFPAIRDAKTREFGAQVEKYAFEEKELSPEDAKKLRTKVGGYVFQNSFNAFVAKKLVRPNNGHDCAILFTVAIDPKKENDLWYARWRERHGYAC